MHLVKHAKLATDNGNKNMRSHEHVENRCVVSIDKSMHHSFLVNGLEP